MQLVLRGRITGSCPPPPQPQTTILDIGIGNGVIASYLRSSFAVNIIGTDVLDYMSADNKKIMPFVKMETENKISLPDKFFTFAMLNDVLHHMSYEKQLFLIKEGLRVSRRGLLVWETEPTWLAYMADRVLNYIHTPQMLIPYAFRSLKVWREVCVEAGLSFTEIPEKLPKFYPLRSIAFLVTDVQKNRVK